MLDGEPLASFCIYVGFSIMVGTNLVRAVHMLAAWNDIYTFEASYLLLPEAALSSDETESKQMFVKKH